jgi:hypothetical protein
VTVRAARRYIDCPYGFSLLVAVMRMLALLITTASLLGCGNALSSLDTLASDLPLAEQPLSFRPSARRVAAIDSSLVAIPGRAPVGQALVLSVPVASGGCRGADTTVVWVSALTATIVPYERVATSPGIACSADFFIERRVVRLSFMQQGAGRVRLVSRSGADRRLTAVEWPVTVE